MVPNGEPWKRTHEISHENSLMVSHGRPWGTMRTHESIRMVPHEAPWSIMESHEDSWGTMGNHETPFFRIFVIPNNVVVCAGDGYHRHSFPLSGHDGANLKQ